ncbi:MAG: two-component sensor histidine kinase, partial [Oscillibacter sp.]|nr:two-component sensor histidine kinase [Oscillibacter sp.]
MSKIRERFQGIYWQQMFVTTGMVALTLLLLGASFFSLSFQYTRSQTIQNIEAKAKVMSQLSVSYLESGRYLSMEELRSDPDF